MNKIFGLMIGTAVTVIGIVLLFMWWYEIVMVLKGIIPPLLIFGGVIACFASYNEISDIIKSKGEGK